MTKTPIAAAVLACCCLPFAAIAAPVASHHGQAQPSAAPDAAACYSQAGTDTGVGVVSQDFTDSGFDAYDAQGADDFTLGAPCVAKGLAVTGVFFNGAGPADSLNVTYYKNKSSHPGKVVKAFTGLSAATGPNFNVKHGKTKLKAAHYWVSAQAVMAFFVGGEWGWEEQAEVNGVEGNWQNPGNGFGTGCTTWGTNTACLGLGGDYMFTVKG